MHCDSHRLDQDRRLLDIAVSRVTARVDAALNGELDIAGARRLRAVLDGLRRDGLLEVTIDMSRLDFLDAAGLGELVRAHTEFGAAGGRIVLCRVQPRHRRLLEITELDTVLSME